MHVSDVLESDGPRAFCPRYNVLAYYSERERTRGTISPARELLFSTGHHIGDFVVQKFIRNSPERGYVYANWSCTKWIDGVNDADHDRYEDTYDNVIGKQRVCKCGRKVMKHNEVDLILPSLMLTGHPDLLLLKDGVFYIHEFKSWERKDMPFDDLKFVDSKHKLQVTFYYKMLKPIAAKIGARVSKKLVVDYIDRSMAKLFGGHPYKALVTPPELDEFMTPFRNKLQHAVNGIKTRQLPPRICESGFCTRARNCDLATECFERRIQKLPPLKDKPSANSQT